jgi:hypothetical protein
MQRTYLEEDLQLIRKYFPGAKAIALHTPFDLTKAPETDPWKLRADSYAETTEPEWYGDLSWNQ